MITVTHPALPYSLDYDQATGAVIRRRSGFAEQGNETDALLAVVLLDLQKLDPSSVLPVDGGKLEVLESRLASVEADLATLKTQMSADNQKIDQLVSAINAQINATPAPNPGA
jgi:hypothetical protein